MASRCKVCNRPDAGTINETLANGRSARSVALEYGLSPDTVQRHVSKHLARAVARAATPADVPSDAAGAPSDPLSELVDALRPKALTGDPQVAHQYRLALAARDENRNAAPQQRDLASEPEWIALRTRLLAALRPHPEAKAAVIAALEGS